MRFSELIRLLETNGFRLVKEKGSIQCYAKPGHDRLLSKLPVEKAEEVADFADFVLKRHDESLLQEGVTQIVGDSEVFAFLADEEDLYTRDDLKVRFK